MHKKMLVIADDDRDQSQALIKANSIAALFDADADVISCVEDGLNETQMLAHNDTLAQ
jgi:hypothetical protein